MNSPFLNFDFSELNSKFYDFDRKGLLKNKPLSNRLSSNDIDYSRIHSEEQFLLKAISFLTKLSYGLFFYITKEKIPNIIFDYKDSGSYCALTENKIVISTSLLTNTSIPYQNRVDATLGIIFHEFYHKKFTITDISKILDINRELYYDESTKKVNKFLKTELKSKFKSSVVNILEDRRIEYLGLEHFPGYGFFFDETRKIAFFLQRNRTVNKSNILGCLLDYIMIKVLLPELEEDSLKLYTLKKSKLLNSLIFRIEPIKTNTVLEETLQKLKMLLDKEEFISIITFADILQYANKILELIPVELFSNDENGNTNENSEYNNTTNIINETSSFLGIESYIKPISDDLINELEKAKEESIKQLKNIESDNSLYKELKIKIEGETKLSIYNYIKIVEEPIKPIQHSILKEAQRLSNDLCKTLGFLDEKYNNVENSYELTEGEIDEDELYSISYRDNIFTQTHEKKGYSLALGVLVDESGSMMTKIREALLSALILCLSVKDNKHIDLFIYGHSTRLTDDSEEIELYKYYNTTERFTDYNRLFSIKSRTNNIDGFAIKMLGNIMKKSESRRKVMIVISDGLPNGMYYKDTSAIRHTKQKVEELKKQGFYIIQVCIDNIENSSLMFDNVVEFKNKEKFIQNMKNILLKELNYFFLDS